MPVTGPRRNAGRAGRALLCLGCAAWTVWVWAAASPEAPVVRQPNIILLVVDTLRADYLGCYGFKGDISPAIDRLAAESVLFERCISQAPWTKPSIASLFTSLHPLTHRVTDHDGRYWRDLAADQKTSALPGEAVTLAEVLRGLGYATAAWTANGWITEKLGFSAGFDAFHSPEPDTNILEAKEIWTPAWSWLKAQPRDRPFFLYLHFMDPHGPWRWRPEERLSLVDSPSLGSNRDLTIDAVNSAVGLTRFLPTPLDLGRSLRGFRATYAAGVKAFDADLGTFLRKLRGSRPLKNTLLIFVADHGEELYDHGGWGHGDSLHRHQIRVPLIVRLPGGSRGGTRVGDVVSLIDLMPTLLSAAGAPSMPPAVQGEDLWDAIRGVGSAQPSGTAYAGAVRFDSRIISIQDRHHKLVWVYPTTAVALYDLDNDPKERTNVAATEAAVRDRLVRQLRRKVRDLESRGSLLESTEPLTPEEIEKLKALGYVSGGGD